GAPLGLPRGGVEGGGPLGWGGAIAPCATGWDEPFLVCNGDLVCDIDIGLMIAAHRARSAELSIALYEVDDPSRFGVVALDGDRITRFVEKPPAAEAPSNLINAGVWLFEPHVARELDATRFNRVEDELFPGMADGGRAIVGFHHRGYWADVGTSAAYLQTNIDLLRGDAPALAAEGFPALLDEGATVAASAMLGMGVVAGAGCRIEPGAFVTASVLWDGVHIGEGARVDRSVLATGARVGAGAVLEGVVLGHGAEVAAGEHPPEGTEVDDETVFRDGAIHPVAGSRSA
ncbi:MAG: NDP-sugar synthase, partial [Chloroflexi bacterium]|nr:NDP-sugar synthase [Chloroflexota bacterium]